MRRTVLFDADGVLVDGYSAYRRIWGRWSAMRQLDSAAVWAATHGRRPEDTIAEMAPHLDAAAEYELLRRYMADEEDGFPLYPGVATMLGALPVGRWGVVTSGDAETVARRLAAGGTAAPPVLVDGSMVGRGKPDPEGYLLAARLAGASARECLVVEDAPEGILAGKAAGMRVLAISSTHAVAELVGADDIVRDLRAAVPLIKSWLT